MENVFELISDLGDGYGLALILSFAACFFNKENLFIITVS